MNDEGANNPEANSKRSALGLVYVLIVFVSAVILGSMGYVYYVGNSMVAGQAPLIDAAMKIKLEATTAHLWLEEIMSGDRHENIDGVLVHIDRAEQYARIMLEGSASGQGRFGPLRDQDMRAEITEVRTKLAEFRRITLARWETRTTAAAGTELDQMYDAIFKDFVKQADNVGIELRRLIENQLSSFQIVQIILIGLCLSVTVIIGITFGRFVRRRIAHEQELDAAYEQLQRSEQKFRYIAEQSIVGLIITQDGRFKYANQAASAILEYPIEEILTWDTRVGYIKIVHPSDRAFVTEQERRKQAGKSDVVTHYAWKALTKRGRTRCVETYWKPISFQGKGANLMTMIDITERDRAEKAFKRSEKLYRELVASVSGIVWECDANTIEFSFVSKEAERLLGYPARRWINEPGFWQEHIHEEDRQWAIDYFAKATAEKRDHELEYRMISADNRTVWLRDIVHVVVENNKPVTLRGIMTDITDRKLVEQEIVNLAKFPAEDPDPVLRVLSDCTILYRNEASEPLMEFWRCIQDVPVPDIARTCIEEAFNSGNVVHDEVQCCDKVFSLTFAPVVEAGYVNIYAHDITERRQAEEALIESQESLAQAQRITHIGNWDWNVEQNNLSWSDEMFRIFGLDRAEFTANYNDFINIVHPKDREFVNEQVQSALEGRAPFDCQFRLLLKDGTLKDIEAKGKIFRDENGKPMRMIGTNQDITKRKQDEEALRDSEERFKRISECAFEGIFMHDKGRIVDANKALAIMSGYELSELIGMDGLDLVAPESRELIAKNLQSEFDKPFEVVGLRKDGSTVPLEIQSKEVSFKGQQVMVVAVRDITDRKRAYELLRTSEANYRAIFESANDAIFIHDIETGEILDFNPKMSEIFGYTRAEAQNFSVDDLSSGKPGYTQQDAVEWIRKASDGTPQVFEWQCRHKSGRLFWAEVSLKKAKISGENRMLAIIRDITERKA